MNPEQRNALGEGLFEDSYKTFGSCRATIEASEPIIEAEILEDGDFYEPLAKESPFSTSPTPSRNPATRHEHGAKSRSYSHNLTSDIYHDSSRFYECKESQGLEEAGGVEWAWWSPPATIEFFSISGVGERTDEDCGVWFKRLVCSGCGEEYKSARHSCHQRRCPECWGDWLNRAVADLCERLEGYRQAYEAWREERVKEGVKGLRREIGNPMHVILSPPPSEYGKGTPEDLKRLRRKARRFVREMGLWGGYLIFHAYRIKKSLKPLLKRFGGSYWDLVREDVLGLGGWEYYVVYSPHFHVVGFGRCKEKSNDFYERTGWIYKFKGHLAKKDRWGAVRYLLSHATFADGTRTHTAFGNMVFLVAEVVERGKEPLTCPKCGSPLVWQFYDGDKADEEAFREWEVRVYRFKRLVKGVKDG